MSLPFFLSCPIRCSQFVFLTCLAEFVQDIADYIALRASDVISVLFNVITLGI